jgi:acetyl esterase
MNSASPTPYLDPQAAALIAKLTELGIPATHTLSPTEARQAYLQRRFATQRIPAPLHEVQDLTCPGPAGDLALRLYRNTEGDAPSPVLVYFHGGGWVIGDLETHDVLCRDLARYSGYTVIAVDYRLAPEHVFPAAVDDANAAVNWVFANAEALHGDPDYIAVGGDSAGGNLAAVVCLSRRDAALPAPRFQLLIYPATDMHGDTASHQRFSQGYLLTRDSIDYFLGHYLPQATDAADWRASPLLHPSHANLPPALVLTAGFDPLCDEGRAYADALSAAGTPCQYVCFARQVHGFVPMGKALTEADTAVALCAHALRRATLD